MSLSYSLCINSGGRPLDPSTVSAEHRFRDGPSIQHRWVATRELMATKRLVRYVENEGFQRGWGAIVSDVVTSSGLERLLHIDLLVRVSSFVRKLRVETERALQSALSVPLPSLDIVAASEGLPKGAKPAEIRENVAIALRHASGAWVDKYLIESLANEDRSQRCRIKIVECLAERTPCIEVWMDYLSSQDSLRDLQTEQSLNSAAKRLSDISLALTHGVRQNRSMLKMTEATGPKLADFSSSLLRLKKGDRLPTRLVSASSGIAILLDELLSVELSLIDEPSMYSPLAVIRKWWQVIPYPPELVRSLEPIVSKLDTAVLIRARAGQKSNALVGHLANAIGGRRKAKERLLTIANRHEGLLPEIDDWLRGRERAESAIGSTVTASLQGVADYSVLSQFARTLLEVKDIENQLELSCIELDEALKAIIHELFNFAHNNQIETYGDAGTTVEYRGEMHSSVDGRIPSETKVRIVREGVLRRRLDGGYDVLAKATVE